MATAIQKECMKPSDVMKYDPEGHGTAMVLFLSDDACICMGGAPSGTTKEEYQKVYLFLFIA